jgi:hypothetical protein
MRQKTNICANFATTPRHQQGKYFSMGITKAFLPSNKKKSNLKSSGELL